MSDEGRIRELLADHVLGLLRPDDAARVERALSRSPELRAEADALRTALYAIPEALEPEPPTPAAWQALRSRIREETGTQPRQRDGTTATSAPGVAPATAPAAPMVGRAPAGTPPALVRTPPRAIPALVLALSVAVLLLAGTVVWGALQHHRAMLSGHEEAVVAYWMREPDLHIVPLEALGEVHAGVVCILPDGRAMALQPHAPTAGRDYVLYGITDAGRIELGRTRGRLIEFKADGVQSVELALAGTTGGLVARATLPR